MRRLSVLLIAALLALAISVPGLAHAKSAQAVGTTCYFSDAEGTVYDDGYFAYPPVNVGGPGDFHQAQVDIKAWRFTDPGNHHCLRGYYTSAWTTDQSWANINDVLRVWTCGQFAGQMTASTNGNDWRAALTAYSWTGAAGYGAYIWVNDVWPNGANVFFVDYSFSGSTCGRQVDNFYSSVAKPNWVYVFGPVTNGNPGYLNENCFNFGGC
jgi:hypothetical protein